MKIYVHHQPPKLYWIVRLFFPKYDFDKTTAFTFGSHIYSKHKLASYHLLHEKIHCHQMMGSRIVATVFFLVYWVSKSFRARMEGEAYGEQYKFMYKKYGKSKAFGVVADELFKAYADSVPMNIGEARKYLNSYLTG